MYLCEDIDILRHFTIYLGKSKSTTFFLENLYKNLEFPITQAITFLRKTVFVNFSNLIQKNRTTFTIVIRRITIKTNLFSYKFWNGIIRMSSLIKRQNKFSTWNKTQNNHHKTTKYVNSIQTTFLWIQSSHMVYRQSTNSWKVNNPKNDR